MPRSIKKSVLAVLMLGLFTACYSTGDKEDCLGLDCPVGLDLPDGGEVRITYVQLPDGSPLRFVNSYFISRQTPDYVAPPPWGTCYSGSVLYPENRDYVDVGRSVTVTVSDEQMVAQKTLDGRDSLFRPHDLFYFAFSPAPLPDGFLNGWHSAVTDNGLSFDRIYMPPMLEVTSPADTGVRQIKKGEDVVIKFNYLEQPPAGVMTTSIVVFWMGEVSMSEPLACVGRNDGSGEIVVPKEIIDMLPDEGGLMQVGTEANEAVLSEDGRRIDLWGETCVAFPWTKVN